MALLVHTLACAFGLGSWVAVNGLWVELPLIVNSLPEGWELPSYLTVLIQMANLGPLLIALMHKARPGRLSERAVIYAILSVGVLSCGLLAFFWDRTSIVAGASHSTAFFIIAFFLSLVDCTSSVTFLPFMMRLPAEYITTYFIGEGLSGFVPGVVALAQGAGMAECVNSTQATTGNHTGGNHSFLQTEYLPPNFSTQVFFFFLTAMMCISLAAFIALNRIRPPPDENLMAGSTASVCSGLDNPAADTDGKDAKWENEEGSHARPPPAELDHSVYQLAFIYFLVVWVNGATNGVLPSVQTYSCMPYGNLAYHLSAALASVANPGACTVAMFFQNRSLVFLGALALLGTGFGSYNMAAAAMSPCPLLQGSAAGEVIIVLSWLSFTGTLSYVKVMLGVILRDRSRSALVWCGAAAQAGSLLGSVTVFPLVNVLVLFKAGDFCNTKCPL
ncbi:solute carrier family 52, riboflavin transporter, member 3-A isoform X2 [Phyllopteryx taeniolatus]|uniref:solute carrier family 52, riboflavin transporter, member 3-A isoform X2 n=1 Tax=Phyllopteryx taeniolatus TaxID=161469 RepID=UPI002AD26F89|nr:solute carrier family 52, riboflavin transporter, member 3-A isoform X2 [Phyllopteryx taeniolatus]